MAKNEVATFRCGIWRLNVAADQQGVGRGAVRGRGVAHEARSPSGKKGVGSSLGTSQAEYEEVEGSLTIEVGEWFCTRVMRVHDVVTTVEAARRRPASAAGQFPLKTTWSPRMGWGRS